MPPGWAVGPAGRAGRRRPAGWPVGPARLLFRLLPGPPPERAAGPATGRPVGPVRLRAVRRPAEPAVGRPAPTVWLPPVRRLPGPGHRCARVPCPRMLLRAMRPLKRMHVRLSGPSRPRMSPWTRTPPACRPPVPGRGGCTAGLLAGGRRTRGGGARGVRARRVLGVPCTGSVRRGVPDRRVAGARRRERGEGFGARCGAGHRGGSGGRKASDRLLGRGAPGARRCRRRGGARRRRSGRMCRGAVGTAGAGREASASRRAALPFVPGHVSGPAERAAFRDAAGGAWGGHAAAVSRVLTRMPALRGQELDAARTDLVAAHAYLTAGEGPLHHRELIRDLRTGGAPAALRRVSRVRSAPAALLPGRGPARRGRRRPRTGGRHAAARPRSGQRPGRILGAPLRGPVRYAVWSVTGRKVRQLIDRPGGPRRGTRRSSSCRGPASGCWGCGPCPRALPSYCCASSRERDRLPGRVGRAERAGPQGPHAPGGGAGQGLPPRRRPPVAGALFRARGPGRIAGGGAPHDHPSPHSPHRSRRTMARQKKPPAPGGPDGTGVRAARPSAGPCPSGRRRPTPARCWRRPHGVRPHRTPATATPGEPGSGGDGPAGRGHRRERGRPAPAAATREPAAAATASASRERPETESGSAAEPAARSRRGRRTRRSERGGRNRRCRRRCGRAAVRETEETPARRRRHRGRRPSRRAAADLGHGRLTAEGEGRRDGGRRVRHLAGGGPLEVPKGDYAAAEPTPEPSTGKPSVKPSVKPSHVVEKPVPR